MGLRFRSFACAATFGIAAITTSPVANAFCEFYVAGADEKFFNNATMIVLMREGTRTVLSMQNNYQGPSEDFAMVIPVPIVLKEENVKTLLPDIFDRVDKLAAPRLVEYWEQAPCYEPPQYEPNERMEEVRAQFGAFYAALFDRPVEKNPGAVVTGYSWGKDDRGQEARCEKCRAEEVCQVKRILGKTTAEE